MLWPRDHNGHVQSSVANAKAKLSQLIRIAQSKREVIITDRGRPVARLVACRDDEAPTLEARLDSFVEAGQLRVARAAPRRPWPPATPRKGALARFQRDRG